MVGTASPWLIPPINGLRLNWLANAEISASPQEPDKTGLSIFQYDQFEFSEFARQLPPYAVALDATMRDRYQLDPRRWTKFGFVQGRRDAVSQYFVLNPLNTYPISSLRTGLALMARESGVKVDTGLIEPGFLPALESPSTIWALIAKWRGDRPLPRISCMITPEKLGALLGSLEAAGLSSRAQAEAYAQLAQDFIMCPHVFVSLDPTDADSLVLDFERPPTKSVPENCRELWNDPPESASAPSYLKCRLADAAAEPAWKVYRPLADVLPSAQFAALTSRPGAISERARAYYDENNASIIESLGTTYQAGLIGKTANADLTLTNLIKASGLRAGERVLDLGCGSGGPAIAMAKSMAGVEVIGLTISAAQTASAVQHVGTADVADRVTIVAGDYQHCPITSGCVDRIVFFESLGYADDLLQVLREAHRCLRTGGSIYIKDVVRKPDPLRPAEALDLAEFDAVYAQRTPTPEAIAKAMAVAGFQDLKFEPLTNVMDVTGFFGAMFDHKAQDGLTEFGRRHYRAYRQLPVTFAHFSGSKP